MKPSTIINEISPAIREMFGIGHTFGPHLGHLSQQDRDELVSMVELKIERLEKVKFSPEIINLEAYIACDPRLFVYFNPLTLGDLCSKYKFEDVSCSFSRQLGCRVCFKYKNCYIRVDLLFL